jgi:hypothetical protein
VLFQAGIELCARQLTGKKILEGGLHLFGADLNFSSPEKTNEAKNRRDEARIE